MSVRQPVLRPFMVPLHLQIGAQALICESIAPGGIFQSPVRIRIPPQTWTHDGRTAPVYLVSNGDYTTSSPDTRFYAGQADPSDSSHFTIRYECKGATDTIDGYLDDEGLISLQPRNEQ